ncbi:hypothetical protein ELZ19_06730 [Brucella abortus]|uniref:hypothetical protein n=1 Tax=Brucella abortus TaxID=235 RepID=UPI0004E907C1|nr:hypothetical protein [Brucella abortus]KFH18426.1 hypothetical protein IB60_17100 [Brucella abortus LMN1]RUQ67344.1 hypothetical protein ELZ23_15565 [Brucella abortus]RUQ78152.1 hypothetical protein ELZ22_17310 [Brucella abortus]RUQ88269.1 hypothetical protein ELZ18_15515 [Brucella abortus]RUQ90298.1 hypothetical protein ELZ20_15510 [Brucella abortus]
MAKLFGVDIARTINREIAAAGGVLPGVLTKKTAGTRTPGQLTRGNNPSTSTHSFRGFVETEGERRSGSSVPTSNAVVSILGASVLPAAVPEVNDVAAIDGGTYELLELLERDPASALYRFRAQES